MKKLLVTLCLCALVVPNVVFATDVALQWDANPEPDVAGYKIYLINDKNAADKKLLTTTGKVTTTTVSFEVAGMDAYVLKATAFDGKGNESALSMPAFGADGKTVFFEDVTPPSVPSLLKVLDRIATALESIAGSLKR